MATPHGPEMTINSLSMIAMFPVLFLGMFTKGPVSVAGAVRSQVNSSKGSRFFARNDFEGSEAAVDTALSRLASEEQLLRVRKGLYWKGAATRFGMTRPSVLDVALAIAGPGSGPAGIAAAYALGLTTQVPAIVEVAAPGKAPDPYPGVRFRPRAYERRMRELRPLEVAVLEVLRDPLIAETHWPEVMASVNQLISPQSIRSRELIEEAADEAQPLVRSRLAEILATT
jgi:Family of unknown function (DUF6088)